MSEDGDCGDACKAINRVDRRTLAAVLAINLFQSFGGGVVGWLAHSSGLLGAALDNLADAGVYAISLYAVGRSAMHRAIAARVSGWALIILSAMLLVEVLRRFFSDAEPVGPAMMAAAAVNAALNVVCLRLLRTRREAGVHFKASWIFTSNDTLVNLGIVLSGALVMIFASPLPDLLIGLIVVAIAFHGGREILEEAREANESVRPQ